MTFCVVAQCPISETTNDANNLTGLFGQSFEPQCTSRIQSISFDALAASVPLVGTLEIFEGEGVGGTAVYSQPLSLSVAIGTNTITLDEPFEVLIKNQYTFEITLSVSVSIAKSTTNPYANGQMYLSGSAVSTDDLVFGITMLEVYPAGVSSNLALWLRADANINTTTNGAAVTNWNDLSRAENNYTGSGTNSVYNDAFVVDRPSVTFNANTSVLSTTESTYTNANLYVVVNHVNNSGSNDFFGNISSGDDLIRFEQATDTDTYGYTATSGTDYQSSLSSSHGSVKIFTVENSSLLSTMNVQDIIDGSRRTDDFGVGVTSRAISNQDLGGFSDIAEVILYGGGTNSAVERQKIESYLAIKYGLTYDQNLIASDNTTIWNSTTQSAFHNDVAVIGRDDAGSISIKKSVSIGSDAVVTIENTDVFSTDISFGAWGNNDLSLISPNTVDVDGTLIDVRLSRVWSYSEVGTVGNLDITLDLTQVPDPKTSTDLRLLIDRDGDGFFDNDVLPLAGSLSGQIFTVSGVDLQDGDRFTVGSINSTQTPLPINLLTFEAVRDDKSVRLNWITANEVNNDYFTLEKSRDGIEWSVLGKIKGAGNSSERKSYTSIDKQPIYPRTFYRLKQTDYDGSYEYFNVLMVEMETPELIAYPNPTRGNFNIPTSRLSGWIELWDMSGALVYQNAINENETITTLSISHLPTGVYMVKLKSPHQQEITSFRISKI